MTFLKDFLKDHKGPALQSAFLHFLILVFLVARPYFSRDIKPRQKTIRVDVVALPEKGQKITAPKPVLKPTVTKESIQKKAPSQQKVAKTKVPSKQGKVPLKKKPLKKNLKKKSEKENTQDLEAAAFAKLKEMKTSQKKEDVSQKVLGNRVAKGEDLVGVEKAEYSNYKSVLHRAISGEWNLPQWLLESDLQAIAEIKINSEGALVYKKLLQSSGNSLYDEKVMEAIEAASPFSPPPPKFKSIVRHEGVTLAFP